VCVRESVYKRVCVEASECVYVSVYKRVFVYMRVCVEASECVCERCIQVSV